MLTLFSSFYKNILFAAKDPVLRCVRYFKQVMFVFFGVECMYIYHFFRMFITLSRKTNFPSPSVIVSLKCFQHAFIFLE